MIKENRLQTLLINVISILCEEHMTGLSLEEKIYFLQKEIGITYEEIQELNIIDECLK